ncbi:MAG: hypothetical protein QXN68_00375 [Thermoplasmata archaeon]
MFPLDYKVEDYVEYPEILEIHNSLITSSNALYRLALLFGKVLYGFTNDPQFLQPLDYAELLQKQTGDFVDYLNSVVHLVNQIRPWIVFGSQKMIDYFIEYLWLTKGSPNSTNNPFGNYLLSDYQNFFKNYVPPGNHLYVSSQNFNKIWQPGEVVKAEDFNKLKSEVSSMLGAILDMIGPFYTLLKLKNPTYANALSDFFSEQNMSFTKSYDIDRSFVPRKTYTSLVKVCYNTPDVRFVDIFYKNNDLYFVTRYDRLTKNIIFESQYFNTSWNYSLQDFGITLESNETFLGFYIPEPNFMYYPDTQELVLYAVAHIRINASPNAQSALLFLVKKNLSDNSTTFSYTRFSGYSFNDSVRFRSYEIPYVSALSANSFSIYLWYYGQVYPQFTIYSRYVCTNNSMQKVFEFDYGYSREGAMLPPSQATFTNLDNTPGTVYYTGLSTKPDSILVEFPDGPAGSMYIYNSSYSLRSNLYAIYFTYGSKYFSSNFDNVSLNGETIYSYVNFYNYMSFGFPYSYIEINRYSNKTYKWNITHQLFSSVTPDVVTKTASSLQNSYTGFFEQFITQKYPLNSIKLFKTFSVGNGFLYNFVEQTYDLSELYPSMFRGTYVTFNLDGAIDNILYQGPEITQETNKYVFVSKKYFVGEKTYYDLIFSDGNRFLFGENKNINIITKDDLPNTTLSLYVLKV